MKMKITIDVYKLYKYLVSRNITFIHTSKLAYMLGTSTPNSGRILSKMVEMGLARKYSRSTYKILHKKNVVKVIDIIEQVVSGGR